MIALIVNFNTPEFTEAAIRSIRRQSPNMEIAVYDNSGDYKGTADRVIQNDIDFGAFLNRYPNKTTTTTNDYGSAKHCYTIDRCFELFDEGFILLDSDVLVKRDLSELWKPDRIWVGQPHCAQKHRVNIPRLYPFCCFINTKMCRGKGIRYFNGEYMWELTQDPVGRWYDTGAWFLYATTGLPHEIIRVTDYIEHYGGGSFRKDKPESPAQWLERHSNLYR